MSRHMMIIICSSIGTIHKYDCGIRAESFPRGWMYSIIIICNILTNPDISKIYQFSGR